MSYDAFASTFSQSRKNLRWGELEYFVECIKKYSQDEKISILDIGCGNGRFLDTLESAFPPLSSERRGVGGEADKGSGVRGHYSYFGIDASIGMIEEAQKLHPNHTFKVLDMNHLEKLSSGEKYQFIVFIASFHHLQTPEERKEVLGKAKKLLAPG